MINGIRKNAVVKPGGFIELQATELPVGTTVEVIVLVDETPTSQASMSTHPLANLSKAERTAKIQAALGSWKNDSEITEIFSEIDRARHAYQGRPLATFDE